MAFLEGDTGKEKSETETSYSRESVVFLFLAAPEFFVLAFVGVKTQERPLGLRRSR